MSTDNSAELQAERALKRLKSPEAEDVDRAGTNAEVTETAQGGQSAPPVTNFSGVDEEAAVGTATPTREDTKATVSDKDDRPSDADIIAQENLIKAEELKKQPFIGDLEPVSALEAEYAEGSPIFVSKVKKLALVYEAVRRAVGDGNCFFRSFLFAYMEALIQKGDLQERNRVVTCIRQWKPKMVEAGYQELVFEDAMEVLIDQLNSLGTEEPLSVATLEANLRDPTISPMMVMFLRMLTAAEILRRQDFFMPFILGMSDDELSVEQFCRRHVEPMGEESDHVHIVALSDALEVPVRVVYLDRSLGQESSSEDSEVNSHDFIPELLQARSSDPVQPRVCVLYRPGHYDILYKKA